MGGGRNGAARNQEVNPETRKLCYVPGNEFLLDSVGAVFAFGVGV